MKYGAALFDLDGTLTDPGEGITNSVAYALRELGITPPERKELYKFIGPPLAASFREFNQMTEAEANEAVRLYRVYFGEKGIFENRVYPGVPELLTLLQEAGVRILLATSKPTVYALRILEKFGLAGFFDGAVGSELDGRRTNKGEVVRCALERCTDTQRGSKPAVMIGDRMHDVAGGRENGLDTVGVLYGYGSREELAEAGATMLAATPAQVGELILN